ncbi:MAG: hypothetical protein J6P03_04640 [Opitutales bacterium]|nr:hypothetical protein [Opitutales bacterium]
MQNDAEFPRKSPARPQETEEPIELESVEIETPEPTDADILEDGSSDNSSARYQNKSAPKSRGFGFPFNGTDTGESEAKPRPDSCANCCFIWAIIALAFLFALF